MRGQSSSPIARALSVRCCRSWPASSRWRYSAASVLRLRSSAWPSSSCCNIAVWSASGVARNAFSAAAFSRSAVATAMRSPATSPCSSSAARLAATSPLAAAATAASYSAFCARTAASSSSAASARRSAASFAATASSALRLGALLLRSAVILSSCSAIASKAGRVSCSCAHHASIPAERGGGSAARQSEPSRIAGRLPLSSERMISGSCIGLL
mmetsp:Transcript_39387/g.130398  ORF Transcript_39387/g.130398 Transcript_39387/m.130398 type:complete len:214 (-) Transcript_39387:1337-1978(-)